MRFVKVNIALLLLLTFVIDSFSQEVRMGLEMDYKLQQNITISGKAQFRQTVEEIKYNNNFIIQIGLGYDFNKYISLSGAVRHPKQSVNIDEVKDNNLNYKMRYTVDISLKSSRFDNDFKIKNRVRYQYSMTNKQNLKNFIRDRIEVDYKLNKYMKPYVAVEPYWSIKELSIQKLRLYMGNEFRVLKSNMKVYYIFEGKLNTDDLGSAHIMGLNIAF